MTELCPSNLLIALMFTPPHLRQAGQRQQVLELPQYVSFIEECSELGCERKIPFVPPSAARPAPFFVLYRLAAAKGKDRDGRQCHDSSRVPALWFDELEATPVRIQFDVDPLKRLMDIEASSYKVDVGPCNAKTFTQAQAERQHRGVERIQPVGLRRLQQSAGLLDAEVAGHWHPRWIYQLGDVADYVAVFFHGTERSRECPMNVAH